MFEEYDSVIWKLKCLCKDGPPFCHIAVTRHGKWPTIGKFPSLGNRIIASCLWTKWPVMSPQYSITWTFHNKPNIITQITMYVWRNPGCITQWKQEFLYNIDNFIYFPRNHDSIINIQGHLGTPALALCREKWQYLSTWEHTRRANIAPHGCTTDSESVRISHTTCNTHYSINGE